jgi:hypothetical protein
MEAVSSPETRITFYRSTLRHISEETTLHSHPCEHFQTRMEMNVQVSSTVSIFDQLCNYQLWNLPCSYIKITNSMLQGLSREAYSWCNDQEIPWLQTQTTQHCVEPV